MKRNCMGMNEIQNLFQAAIEAIEIASKMYHVRFTIIRRPSAGFRDGKHAGKWQITVMDKSFFDIDFVSACSLAIKFVVQAHENIKQLNEPEDKNE